MRLRVTEQVIAKQLRPIMACRF